MKPKAKTTVAEQTKKKKPPRLSRDELDELDRDDDAPLVVKKKTSVRKGWEILNDSKKEFETNAIESPKAKAAGFASEAEFAQQNKISSRREEDIERFRAEHFEYIKKKTDVLKFSSRHFSLLEAQKVREDHYPRPRDLKRVEFDTSVVYSADALDKLRHEKIKPIKQNIKTMEGRPADLETVKRVHIPAEIAAHAKRWKTDVGAALFNREAGEKGQRISVPTMQGFYSPSVGVLHESVDPLAFEAAFYSNILEAKLIDIAEAYAKKNKLFILADDAATKAITEARAELEKWERLEESLIRAGERQGIPILRRYLAPLECVFGYSWRSRAERM